MENNGMDEKQLMEFVHHIIIHSQANCAGKRLSQLKEILDKQGCRKEAALVNQVLEDRPEVWKQISQKTNVTMLDLEIAHRRADERREREKAESSGGCR